MERQQLFGVVIFLTGIALAGVQVIHGVQQTSVPLAIVVDAAPLAMTALALAFVGYYLAQDEAYAPYIDRIVAWGAGGVLVFLSLAALSLFSTEVVTDNLIRAEYIAIDNATVGATSGVLVGVYDAQRRMRLAELAHERERIEQFAQKAADTNNYGRAIASATEVEAVSAYCIQGTATLLNARNCAFVELVDDSLYVVDNTMPELGDADIETIVEAVRAGRVGSVSVLESVPEPIEPIADAAVGVVLYDDADRTTVFVVAIDEGDVESAELELVELLVSHATTVLGRLYDEERATSEPI